MWEAMQSWINILLHMKKLPNTALLKFVLTGSLFLFNSCEKKDNIPDCEEAYKLAKSDFDQGKYIYYEYQYLNQDKSGNEAFKNILKQKNINVLFKQNILLPVFLMMKVNLKKVKIVIV